MNRPDIDPAQSKELYEYYRYKVPETMAKKRRVALKTALAISSVARPKIIFPEAHREILENATKGSNGIIIATNHIKLLDFAVVGSLVRRDETVRELADKVFVLAKAGLINTKARWIVEGIGGVPTFRSKDRGKVYNGSRGQAIEDMYSLATDLLTDGYNMKIFPEGTYSQSCVGPIEKGIGVIACRSTQSSQKPVTILPLGIEYGQGPDRNSSAISVGAPFLAAQAEAEIVEQVGEALAEQRRVAAQELAG